MSLLPELHLLSVELDVHLGLLPLLDIGVDDLAQGDLQYGLPVMADGEGFLSEVVLPVVDALD